MLSASLFFALMAVCVKTASKQAPVGEVVFFRSAVTMAIAILFARGRRGALAGVNRRMLITRGLLGTGSMFGYFLAIQLLKLGDATLLQYLSPLFVALMAPLVLGERSTRVIWLALALGFAGVWVVEKPGGAAVPALGIAAALSGAVFSAAAYVSVKRLAQTDETATIVLWFSAVGTVVSAVTAVHGWTDPDLRGWLGLVGAGVTGAIAQILMTRAYAVGGAAQVAVYSYATPVMAYALGQLLLGESPGWQGAAGAGLMVLAGIVASSGAPRQLVRSTNSSSS
jgi:drug/metabolite transporter (DMT)-like permease